MLGRGLRFVWVLGVLVGTWFRIGAEGLGRWAKLSFFGASGGARGSILAMKVRTKAQNCELV